MTQNLQFSGDEVTRLQEQLRQKTDQLNRLTRQTEAEEQALEVLPISQPEVRGTNTGQVPSAVVSRVPQQPQSSHSKSTAVVTPQAHTQPVSTSTSQMQQRATGSLRPSNPPVVAVAPQAQEQAPVGNQTGT